MPQQSETTILGGGLDLVTPAIAVAPNRAISAVNYECEARRGYRRIPGYERYDGQPKPSDAEYWILDFTAGNAAISAGDVVDGLTSGAQGTALVDAVVETGSYAGADAAGYIVLHTVGATSFTDTEALQVSAVTRATADGTNRRNAADTDTLDETYIQAEIARRRALIAQPTGSGPVRGVVMYEGDVYAFRDNAGGTAAEMFKATAAGWVAQNLGEIVEFENGGFGAGGEIIEGEFITGATSGAVGYVERVILANGDWSGTAVGWFIVSGVIGGPFVVAEALNGSISGSANVLAANSALTLPPGGTYDFEIHNFYGAAKLPKLYFCNGVGNAWEWNGTILSPIYTGLDAVNEKPVSIAEHKNHLFLLYEPGLLQFSCIGEPIEFDTTRGAGSFSFGSKGVQLVSATDTHLSVLGQSRIAYVAGTSAANFDLQVVTNEAGAKPFTAQRMTDLMYVDQRGIRKMAATQTTGGFRTGTVTGDIEPIFQAYNSAGLTPKASLRVRARDIYRLFYSDKSGVSVHIGDDGVGECTTFVLPHEIHCAHPGVDANGEEILLCGTTDGYVMEMDKGTSFDGDNIAALIRFPFNHLGAPQSNKRFHKAILEIDASITTVLNLIAEFAYGETSGGSQQFTLSGGGGFWDEAFWDAFYWSSTVQGIAEAHIDGIGKNISILITSDTATEPPHVLSSLTIHYTPRRMLR